MYIKQRVQGLTIYPDIPIVFDDDLYRADVGGMTVWSIIHDFANVADANDDLPNVIEALQRNLRVHGLPTRVKVFWSQESSDANNRPELFDVQVTPNGVYPFDDGTGTDLTVQGTLCRGRSWNPYDGNDPYVNVFWGEYSPPAPGTGAWGMCRYYIQVLPSSCLSDGVVSIPGDTVINACYLHVSVGTGPTASGYLASAGIAVGKFSADITQDLLDHLDGLPVFDDSDPLDQDGNSETDPSSGSPYSGAGGVGTHGTEVSDAQSWPTPPSLSSIQGGLVTLYAATSPQPMQDLGAFLWSDLDLNSLKKLFVDPMDAIFGAAILPCTPPTMTSSTTTIKFGNIDSGVGMPIVTQQYVTLDFGTISIREKWGAFLDYSPYTKVQIWLPYIGFKDLNVDEVMNNPVGVQYIVDCLTGGCSATVGTLTSDGKLHMCGQYAGSCAMEVPLSSNNWSSMLGAAVSIAGSVGGGYMMGGPVGAAVAGGLSLTNAAVSGSMKPTIERSGSVSGPAGFYAIQYPYVIVERPRQSKPLNYNNFEGYPSNATFVLGNLQGFTKVESVHLNGIPALADELQEIESLLKQGVII